MTVGDFLLRRLQEAGIGHMFGVPGDFNLELLQQMEDGGYLKWVGTCNEMNASYAADDYARLNGMGAVAVTNAVGALGAINGIAGSYAEHVPVILITGVHPVCSVSLDQPASPLLATIVWVLNRPIEYLLRHGDPQCASMTHPPELFAPLSILFARDVV